MGLRFAGCARQLLRVQQREAQIHVGDRQRVVADDCQKILADEVDGLESGGLERAGGR